MNATETRWEYCRIMARANATDPEAQEFLVRRPFGGMPSSYQYYNSTALSNQTDNWFMLPSAWVDKAEAATWRPTHVRQPSKY